MLSMFAKHTEMRNSIFITQIFQVGYLMQFLTQIFNANHKQNDSMMSTTKYKGGTEESCIFRVPDNMNQ